MQNNPHAAEPIAAALPSVLPWRLAFNGFCASFVGIGLARFAYTPLIPAIIEHQWFAASDAAYLGAANLAGYLVGAVLATRAAKWIAPVRLLRAMLVLASLAFFACAAPIDFAWFFVWRFLAGFAGAVLMVLAAPTLLPHVAPAKHGTAIGIMFTGVGLGVAASGTLVPLLLQQGLSETWVSLGAAATLFTIAAWGGWPKADAIPAALPAAAAAPIKSGFALRAVYLEYGLGAVGLVPHMIFLVDFVARGLGEGVNVGAHYWVLFGIGAMMGPLLFGTLADRIGFATSLRLAYAVGALLVLLPVFGLGAWSLVVSSMMVGGFTPGIVTLVLGRIGELTHAEHRRTAWSIATTSFAVFQALSAYTMSFLFAHNGGDYRPIFELGAAALLVALAINFATIVHRRIVANR